MHKDRNLLVFSGNANRPLAEAVDKALAWSVVAITSLAACALFVGITVNARRSRVPAPPLDVAAEVLSQ